MMMTTRRIFFVSCLLAACASDSEPELLAGYRVLVVNGHSEYWSRPMYEGLRRYLDGGGNVVCLSGNSLFWRVSFDEAGTVMECRKVDAPGDQVPPRGAASAGTRRTERGAACSPSAASRVGSSWA